jgi:hypothetical protein
MSIKRKAINAHRYSMQLHLGRELLSSEWVLHKCDNPKCVNPKHLFLGDALVNSKDMFAKGRNRVPRGDNHPCRKLTSAKVKTIRKMHATGKYTMVYIASKYNVRPSTIEKIVKMQRWVPRE